MDWLTWTSTGVRIYIGDEAVISLTYDDLSLYAIVIGIGIGLIVGLIISYRTRIFSHRAVKALLAAGCSTPETAKTVDELETRSKSQIKRMLKSGKHLRRVILCANEDEMQGKPPSGFKKFWYGKILGQEIPQKTDMTVARFYIPEEKRIAAEVRYSREGMSPAALVITIVVIIALAVAAMFVIPELLTMAENVFGSN